MEEVDQFSAATEDPSPFTGVPLSLLWVKTGPLFPLNTGGRKRTHSMLVELNKHHHVTFLALCPFEANTSEFEHAIQQDESDPYADEKIWVAHPEAKTRNYRFYGGLLRNEFTSLPFVLEKYISHTMRDRIRELNSCHDFDLIICDFLAPAITVLDARVATPCILFQHNMEAQIWKRLARNQSNFLSKLYFYSQAKRMSQWEKRLSSQFDGIVTVSPEDSRFAKTNYHLSNVLGHVPTGVDTVYFSNNRKAAHPKRIGFLGSMDWMPNEEAVLWFVKEILLLIHQVDPDIEFFIIGRAPTKTLQALATQNNKITLTGTVEDVRPWVTGCSAMVVPLKSGGGTRIKIPEAIAMGTPVVSTRIGAEGLGLTPGSHLLIADEADFFAQEVIRLLHDKPLQNEISNRALEYVSKNLSWPQVSREFVDLCRECLALKTGRASLDLLYHFRIRGTGAESVHIAGISRAFEQMGHRVDFVCPTGTNPIENRGGDPFAGQKTSWITKLVDLCPPLLFELLEVAYNIPAAFAIRRRLTKKKIDLIYERHAFFLIATALEAKRIGVPLVVEVNELVGDRRLRSQPFFASLALWLAKISFQRADLITVVSPHLKRRIVGELGIAADKVMVLPNAVNEEDYLNLPASSGILSQYGIGPGAAVLGFVGWFVPWHQLERLLDAAAPLMEKFPNFVMVLVGSGKLRADLEEQARVLGISERVVFTGPIPHEDIPALLAELDICIVPQSNEFRSPIKLFEYMAAGKAVLAPKTEPIEMVIQDGENGILFDPDSTDQIRSAIDRLLSSPDQRIQIGDNARRDVLAKYTWKTNVESILHHLKFCPQNQSDTDL